MKNPMGAVGQPRLKAPDQLVLPARARLEAGGAPADALLDRMIEADVEVQEWVFLEATPVAAVENLRRGQVERSREQAAVAPGLHQFHPVAEGLEDAAEKRGVEVSMTPDLLVHRGAVKPVHLVRVHAGQLVAAKGANFDSLLAGSPLLAPELVSALGVEAGEIPLE